MVNIEIDGKKINARDGAMVIEAADDAGIYIPRFCYHKKLSIAANCRMCLIEVEKAAKPLPACATPVTDGMKIFTKSPKAIDAQKGVMEFLLINHPLDCPICDQGGECELQDIAMGYGSDVSKFAEKKRVVKDKDLGPLIATDMTRCIHCTRCVRFGTEIAGIRELGATGRGEHTEIGTYVTSNVTSEMSGNVIDLCPVGALTSKPFRFSARAWELVERDTVAPHDCIGSNLKVHVCNGREVIRVVPRENEAINETWISDRDRFSYEGLYSEDRLKSPMLKEDGEWREVNWETALHAVVAGINKVKADSGSDRVGALATPTSTLEELYLMQKVMRQIGVNNIDHRLRQLDFSDQHRAPVFPWLGQTIKDLESNDAVLLVGSNIRKDQPIAAHRLRKASVHGAKIMCLNAVDYDFYIPLAHKIITTPVDYAAQLAGIAKALLANTKKPAPSGFEKLSSKIKVTASHQAIADHLTQGTVATILLGPQAINHPESSTLSMLAQLIASLSESKLGYLPEAGNSAGAWMAGMLPHRCAGGKEADLGLNALEMLHKGLRAYVLLGVEPEIESAASIVASRALNDADFVVSMTSFSSEAMKQYADVMLPIAPFAETSGTFVNAEGQWQSVAGVVPPLGEARPAWKVLRVLGNLFECSGFDYITSEDVLAEVEQQTKDCRVNNTTEWHCPESITVKGGADTLVRIAEVQMYAGDALQRRAHALQNTLDADFAAIRINKAGAAKLGLSNGLRAIVAQNGAEITLPVVIDDRISDNSILIHAGLNDSAALGHDFTPISIKSV